MIGKLLVATFVVGLLFISSASAYMCIVPMVDNQAVMDFKSKINFLALEEDIENGLTEEGLRIKLRYFSPCR